MQFQLQSIAFLIFLDMAAPFYHQAREPQGDLATGLGDLRGPRPHATRGLEALLGPGAGGILGAVLVRVQIRRPDSCGYWYAYADWQIWAEQVHRQVARQTAWPNHSRYPQGILVVTKRKKRRKLRKARRGKPQIWPYRSHFLSRLQATEDGPGASATLER